MEAGRTLDAEIAQKFFGWKWNAVPADAEWADHDTKRLGGFWLEGTSSVNTTNADGSPNCPRYSTDMAAAWPLANKIRGVELPVDHEGMAMFYLRDQGGCWAAGWERWGNEWNETPFTVDILSAESLSAPHAICLAALKLIK